MITGSILLALALESWWGGLVDDRTEAATLASLEAEIVATREEMLRARGVHQTRCEAISSLRGMVGESEEIDVRSLGVLTRDAASVTSVDAPLGVLRGLISSGSLELIDDAELRATLAGWPARLADHRESETFILNVIRDQWVPWLVANSVLTTDWGRGEAEAPSPTLARELRGMLADREFHNLVMMQDYYCRFVLADSESLAADVEALRLQVSAQR